MICEDFEDEESTQIKKNKDRAGGPCADPISDGEYPGGAEVRPLFNQSSVLSFQLSVLSLAELTDN